MQPWWRGSSRKGRLIFPGKAENRGSAFAASLAGASVITNVDRHWDELAIELDIVNTEGACLTYIQSAWHRDIDMVHIS